MPQHPSPHSPPPDDENGPARRLISPQERFAEPVARPAVRAQTETSAVPMEAENPFDAQISARRRDELERRHLPPGERARQERARLRLEAVTRESANRESLRRESANREAANREAANPENSRHESTVRRRGATSAAHEQRARAERQFAQTAREVAPVALPKRRGAPKWLKRVLALVALILVAQLGFMALTAPQFGVHSVDIQGIESTPHDELRLLARRLIGQNLLRLKGAEVERAARLLPTVADARVIRLAHWPPKAALRISERVPVLQVGAGQNWWVVDRKGVPFRRAAEADAALYSVVAPQFTPQVREPLPAKIWARALVLQAALEADNRLAVATKARAEATNEGDEARFWQLRRIYFDRDGLASLRLSRAPHRELLVRLGDEGYAEKLVRARQSLAYFECTGRQASELDLVSLERPVWTQLIVQTSVKSASDAG